MKTYLVTGGAGFIGSNFIHYLFTNLKEPFTVVNLDKLSYAANLRNLGEILNKRNHIFVKGDILNQSLVEQLMAQYHPDYIIHFAAESHVDRSIADPSIFIVNNIQGTQCLLEAAIKYPVKRFLQVSTDEVYGSLGETGLFNESSPLQPSSPYAASKAAADLLISAYGKTFDLPYCITRSSNNYGPRQFPEKLIPLTIQCCLENKSIPVYGDGSNIRDWMWVFDHCRAIDLVLHKGKNAEIYNVAANCEESNLALIQMIIEEISLQLPVDDPRKKGLNMDLIQYVADRKGHDFRYGLDSHKLQAQLGWRAEQNLGVGIAETVEWYLHD